MFKLLFPYITGRVIDKMRPGPNHSFPKSIPVYPERTESEWDRTYIFLLFDKNSDWMRYEVNLGRILEEIR